MNIDSSDSVVRALSEQMRDFDREVLGIITKADISSQAKKSN